MCCVTQRGIDEAWPDKFQEEGFFVTLFVVRQLMNLCSTKDDQTNGVLKEKRKENDWRINKFPRPNREKKRYRNNTFFG